MASKKNPLNLNALQLKTLMLLQELARLDGRPAPDSPEGHILVSGMPNPHGDHFHLGEAVVMSRDATGLANEGAWAALERKGPDQVHFPGRRRADAGRPRLRHRPTRVDPAPRPSLTARQRGFWSRLAAPTVNRRGENRRPKTLMRLPQPGDDQPAAGHQAAIADARHRFRAASGAGAPAGRSSSMPAAFWNSVAV